MTDELNITTDNTDAAFIAKFVQAQSTMTLAHKDGVGTGGQYQFSYATLASVQRATLPAFNAAGLVIFQQHGVAYIGAPPIPHIEVETFITDGIATPMSSGVFQLPVTNRQGGAPSPQDFGAALTYARRYSWMTITGLAPADDEDIDAQPAQTQQQHTRAERTPAFYAPNGKKPLPFIQAAQAWYDGMPNEDAGVPQQGVDNLIRNLGLTPDVVNAHTGATSAQEWIAQDNTGARNNWAFVYALLDSILHSQE